MKRREKIMLALFVIDLFLLPFYKQIHEDVGLTFSFKKIVFWWFYFFPIAYFMGGYFLSYFILVKSKIILNKNVQQMLLALIVTVTGVSVLATAAILVHQWHPFLPDSLVSTIVYVVLIIYARYIFVFSVIGFLTAICLFSHLDRRQDEQKEN